MYMTHIEIWLVALALAMDCFAVSMASGIIFKRAVLRQMVAMVLLFGLFCAPVYISMGGVAFAISWWLSGIPFDVTHCIGNFFIALVMFNPLRKLLEQQYEKMMRK